jgi:hypothetical protein
VLLRLLYVARISLNSKGRIEEDVEMGDSINKPPFFESNEPKLFRDFVKTERDAVTVTVSSSLA